MRKLLVIIAITICISLLACRRSDQRSRYLSIDAVTINNFIKDIIDEINQNYADEIKKEKLEEGAISGMLSLLDENSAYISQEEFDAFNNSTRGEFLGIGVEMRQLKEGIEIISVIDESPAMKSDVRVGDIVTHIDQKEVSSMHLKEILSKLSSDTALKVRLSIVRNKTDKIQIDLKKSIIQLKSVSTSCVSNVGIIKISYFNEGTAIAVNKGIDEIKKKKISGVIVDLRNNPGGILEQAIAVTSLFLNSGKIVDVKSKNVSELKQVFADGSDKLHGLPMAVLIDRNSASGAEVMAAALRDNKRAVIMGEQSYGKGSLQTIIPIPGRGAIKLTTAYLFSPSGNPINQKGVTPNILIDPHQKLNVQDKDDKSRKKKNSIEQQLDAVVLRAIDLLLGISVLK